MACETARRRFGSAGDHAAVIVGTEPLLEVVTRRFRTCAACSVPAFVELARQYKLDDAEYATKDFFAHLLQNEVIADANAQRGRFRALICATFCALILMW